MITAYSVHIFVCHCDACGIETEVEETQQIYNGAQAARSLGWSFGKDRSCYCCDCRNKRLQDKHRNFRK